MSSGRILSRELFSRSRCWVKFSYPVVTLFAVGLRTVRSKNLKRKERMKPAVVFLVVAFFFCDTLSLPAQGRGNADKQAASSWGADLEQAGPIEQKKPQAEQRRETLRQTPKIRAKGVKENRKVEKGNGPEEKPTVVLFGPKGSNYLSGLLD
jgi:hypothetical protein